MRYLKQYIIFETLDDKISTSFISTKGIIEDIYNICDDLRDDGLDAHIYPGPNDSIGIKMLGLERNGMGGGHVTKIQVTFTSQNMDRFEDGFKVSEIQDTCNRLLVYLNSENFICSDVSYITSAKYHAARISMNRSTITGREQSKKFDDFFNHFLKQDQRATKKVDSINSFGSCMYRVSLSFVPTLN